MPRIEIALVYSDGRKEVVTAGRPVDLIAFADEFGKSAPSEPHLVREAAWLAHRAKRVEQPLDSWIDELDDISANPDTVAEVQAELEEGKVEAGGEQPAPAPTITLATEAEPATSYASESHA